MSVRNYTSEFPEVQKLVADKLELTRQLRRIRRKLHSINRKHEFLIDVTEQKDKSLELAVEKLLKAAGFKDVFHVGDDSDREDVLMWFDGVAYLIECRGRGRGGVSTSDTGQVGLRLDVVKGVRELKGWPKKIIMVLNLNLKMPLSERPDDPYNSEIGQALKNSEHSYVFSKELVRGYVMLKKGHLTKHQFLKDLSSPGIVRFKERK